MSEGLSLGHVPDTGLCPKKRTAPSAARGRFWEKGGAGGRHGPYVGTRARPWL